MPAANPSVAPSDSPTKQSPTSGPNVSKDPSEVPTTIFPSPRPDARQSTSPASRLTASPAAYLLPRQADVPIACQLIVWIASTSTVTKTITSNLVLQLLLRKQYYTNLIEL